MQCKTVITGRNPLLFSLLLSALVAGGGLRCTPADDEPTARGEDGRSPAQSARDPRWATPLPGRPGLPNLHRITDTLYRGAQPTEVGFAELRKMGVKTVINLRAFHSDLDEFRRAGVEFNYVPISFKAWHPEKEDVVKFLAVVRDPANFPIFFHCQHGADRTGMMSAIYRMVVQGWSNDDALTEMTDGGYGFHSIWRNLERYVRKFDASKYR